MKRGEAEGLETRFAIVSNLTLMTDEIAADIKKRGNVALTSSLDGPPTAHDKQRVYPGGKGTYASVVRWAKKLKEEYEINVPFLPTFTVSGLGHEREIVDEYLDRGVRILYLRCVNDTGRAHEGGYSIGVRPEQFVASWKRTLEYVLEKDCQGHDLREGQTVYLLSNLLDPGHAYMCLRRPCGCGISQVTVAHGGKILSHSCKIEYMKVSRTLFPAKQ